MQHTDEMTSVRFDVPATEGAWRRKPSANIPDTAFVNHHDRRISYCLQPPRSDQEILEDEFVDWIVHLVAEQAEVNRNKSDGHKLRQSNIFYKVVYGGNVKAIEAVLSRMRQNEMHEAISWVVGKETEHKRYDRSSFNKCCIVLGHVMMLFLCTLFFTLFSPVAYICHIMCAHFLNARQNNIITANIELPLVFAVLSEQKQMIKLFREAGCPLDAQDSNGNNIYHYLASLSREQPEKTIRCHRILCTTCAEESNLLRFVIVQQRNDCGLSAIEAVAAYGSMKFLSSLMICSFGRLYLSASENSLWVNIPGHHKWFQQQGNVTVENKDESVNVWGFNINDYDLGDTYKKQSLLLQLVASREVVKMSEAETDFLIHFRLLQKWFSLKRKDYRTWHIIAVCWFLAAFVLILNYVAADGQKFGRPTLYNNYCQFLFKEIRAPVSAKGTQTPTNWVQCVGCQKRRCNKTSLLN